MKFKQIIVGLVFLLINQFAMSQSAHQVVKGRIIDEETRAPLKGVIVQVECDNPMETVSDSTGSFRFNSVAFGRVNLRFVTSEYQEVFIENILVTSAKEIDVDVEMKVKLTALKTVDVGVRQQSGLGQNRMATVSNYVLKIDEVEKFAGSLDDPMRLVTNYAGIIQQSSGFNNFTVRGNAPIGMLYRLEGVPIHNPNHFAEIGSTGGFVTQFSTQLLTTSEFFSGAFPAEFGNANSAVFDFKFRKGNSDKHEHAAQINVFGVDVATEGPFKKGGKASYLINYRYSSLGLLARTFQFESIVPAYQDLSFNLNFPTKKAGNFNLFGIGGLSDLTISANRDSASWDENTNRTRRNLGSNSGAIGLVHYIRVSDKGYLHSVLAGSKGNYFDNASYLASDLRLYARDWSDYTDERITFTSDYNHKFSKRHSNKTGLIVTHLNHDFVSARYNKQINYLDTLGISEGASQTVQAFSQSQFNLGAKFTFNAGVHFLYFALNGQYSVEPRLGFSYILNNKSILSGGYGLHGRVEDLSIYFYEEIGEDGTTIRPNENLGLMQAHHGVLKFTHYFRPKLKWSTEVYYQYMDNVPSAPGGTFSTLNLLWQFPTEALENIGVGRNYGIETSLERFTKHGYYFMITAALFNSEYLAGDGVWRSTEFNQLFSYNVLVGKEYKRSDDGDKERYFSWNINVKHSGGTWRTPVDVEESKIYGWTRYDFDNPYSQRQPNNFLIDASISFKNIRPKVTGEFSIRVKNLLYNRTPINEEWDEDTQTVRIIRDYGMIPVIGYKIWF
jgi:hypothetical protein